jgi:RNA polymerase sigma factor (sigma-70 family)
MIDVLDLEAALQRLGELAPRQEAIVEMRFYAGLKVEEIADVLGVSPRTVLNDWRMARAWLRARLEDE